MSKPVWVLLESDGTPVSYGGNVCAYRTRDLANNERLSRGMGYHWSIVRLDVPAPARAPERKRGAK